MVRGMFRQLGMAGIYRKENRLDYYNALETYEVRGELGEFADLVAEL